MTSHAPSGRLRQPRRPSVAALAGCAVALGCGSPAPRALAPAPSAPLPLASGSASSGPALPAPGQVVAEVQLTRAVAGSPPRHTARVLHGTRVGMTNCWRWSGLAPRAWTVRAVLRIGADGEVEHVAAQGPAEAPAKLLRCVEDRLRASVFVSPEVEPTVLEVTVRFL